MWLSTVALGTALVTVAQLPELGLVNPTGEATSCTDFGGQEDAKKNENRPSRSIVGRRADNMNEALIEKVRKRAANASRAKDGADAAPATVLPAASAGEMAETQSALRFEVPALLKEP